MKKVNQPLRFPDDFRETVTIMNFDPSVLLQDYIDLTAFYVYFRKHPFDVKLRLGEKMRVMMMGYQCRGTKWQDVKLWDINKAYLDELIELDEDTSLSVEEQDHKSTLLIRKWERKAGPLLNYPREIMLENGGKVKITFNYMLLCMALYVHIPKALDGFMSRVSIAMLHAREYSDRRYNNEGYKEFMADLQDKRKGLWLPYSKGGRMLKKEFDLKLADLDKEMIKVLSYEKRLVVFRALVKEWYVKMIAADEK